MEQIPVESGTPVFQVKYFIQNCDFYMNDLCVIIKIKVIFFVYPPHPRKENFKKKKKG